MACKPNMLTYSGRSAFYLAMLSRIRIRTFAFRCCGIDSTSAAIETYGFETRVSHFALLTDIFCKN